MNEEDKFWSIQQRLLEFEKKKKIYHSCNMYLIKPQQWKDHLAMKIKWGDIDKNFEHDIAGAQLTFLNFFFQSFLI